MFLSLFPEKIGLIMHISKLINSSSMNLYKIDMFPYFVLGQLFRFLICNSSNSQHVIVINNFIKICVFDSLILIILLDNGAYISCLWCTWVLMKMRTFDVKRELVALIRLSSRCLMIVLWRFLTMPRVCLQFVIMVFPDHTDLLFYCRK